MPNWCANRIKLTVSVYAQAEVEAWANGTMYPYYKRAINQSIRMFIAGVAGRLKPGISDNIILHSVADDIRPSQIRGYDTTVNRDGAVVYSSGGKPVLLDRGLYIEVADAPAEKGKNLAMALHITGEKSGETVEVRGDKAFVQGTIQYIPHFNASSGKMVPLTHPVQRQKAGYTTEMQSEHGASSTTNTLQLRHVMV